ncbi:MAG: Gfo/Idh/MocA family oxidoreductase [Verrucomicrobiota bacterium]|nr:Gfo/Idh/MocA family oxidoreductase [Verrucomicrobiota bacterium]
MKWFVAVVLFVAGVASGDVLDVAVLGLGGRVQLLLAECLKLKEATQREIRVVAVCDDFGQKCLNDFIARLEREGSPWLADYQQMFQSARFYADDEEGLQKLFQEHPKLDEVLITSANRRHLTHLNVALANGCSNIFIEKPVVKSMEEWRALPDTKGATIHVGLVLRYSTLAKLVDGALREHREALGKLKKVTWWEHVKFGQTFTIMMMNWRRYRSLSGGFLVEKAIHDLDLALFFMEAAGVKPHSLSLTTNASHDLFKKSRQSEILARLLEDKALREKTELWDRLSWQRTIDFVHLASGEIDWPSTVETFFKDFPGDDDFSHSDLVPDHHCVKAEIATAEGAQIAFELEVKANEFALASEREAHFVFEHGRVDLDIQYGKMVIDAPNIHVEKDLEVNNQRHAGGDTYVAHTILGTLPEGQHAALFSDPEVQLSTLMALVSEEQAEKGDEGSVRLRQVGNEWMVE